jgi:hypothetical protein
MAVLDDVATYLEAQGIGILGVSLFKGGIPLDTAQTVITDLVTALVQVPGLPPVHVHTQQQATYEQPMLQILVRGEPFGDSAAMQKAYDAFLALDGLSNTVLSGVMYLWLQAMQSPFLLRRDELNRPFEAFNVRCAKAVL